MVNFHSFFEYLPPEPDQEPTAEGVIWEDNPQTLQQTKEKRNANDVIDTECIGHNNNSDSLFESNVLLLLLLQRQFYCREQKRYPCIENRLHIKYIHNIDTWYYLSWEEILYRKAER